MLLSAHLVATVNASVYHQLSSSVPFCCHDQYVGTSGTGKCPKWTCPMSRARFRSAKCMPGTTAGRTVVSRQARLYYTALRAVVVSTVRCACAAVKGALWTHIARWILTDWQPAEHAQQTNEGAGQGPGDAVAPLVERSRLLARLWDDKLNAAHRERMQAAAEELRDNTLPKVRTSLCGSMMVRHLSACAKNLPYCVIWLWLSCPMSSRSSRTVSTTAQQQLMRLRSARMRTSVIHQEVMVGPMTARYVSLHAFGDTDGRN